MDSDAIASQGKRNRPLLIKTTIQCCGVCENDGACSQGQARLPGGRCDARTRRTNSHLLIGIAIVDHALIIAIATVRRVPLVQSRYGARCWQSIA